MMNTQTHSEKWYTPHELAKLLNRNLERTLIITRKFGCAMKVTRGRTFISIAMVPALLKLLNNKK